MLKKILIALLFLNLVNNSNATLIDIGSTAATGYNGSLIFSVWDSAGSYSLNLSASIPTATGTGVDGINTFISDISANTVAFAASTTLTNWLAEASTASLPVSWNITALGAVPGSPINKELLVTTSSFTTTIGTNQVTKIAATDLSVIYTGLNNNSGISANSNEGVISSPSTIGYANAYGGSFSNALPFSTAGTLGSSMGLTLITYKTFGTAFSTITNNALVVTVDTSGNLSFPLMDGIYALPPISPGPEPETYAMLIAGIVVLGAAVKRQKAKQS